MIIPKLVCADRDREYKLYSEEQRERAVVAWLFDGKHHREIDKDVLHLDPLYSKGYQSMGILHHLGLRKEFRNLFHGISVEQAIRELQNTGDESYTTLIAMLSSYLKRK